MTAKLYVEGGGDGKDLHSRCREGFRKLLENCGFAGRMPSIVACGPRQNAYDNFHTAFVNANPDDYFALLVDSEEPVGDINQPWQHLASRDGWMKPRKCPDSRVFLMTTCMETWLVADRHALQEFFGQHLQTSSLPATSDLESRSRETLLQKLEHATRNCDNAYQKGARSFELLAKLNPDTLKTLLPSFERMVDTLNADLPRSR